jgi:hypothetical protein
VPEQLDAFDEAEHPGELSQLHERRKRLGMGRISGQPVVGGGQQVRLADTETTIEVQPDARQHRPPAEELLAAGAALDGLPAELLARRDRDGLRRLGRVGAIAREAHFGEGRRRRQLGDQPFGRHRGLPVDQMSDGAGHAGTLPT